jgi:hypothetical protein
VQFNVFGMKVDLVEDPEIAERGLDGESDFAESRVLIDPDIWGEHRNEIIVHELGHILFERIGLVLCPEKEETIVRTFSIMVTENFYLTKK